jgi:hypothetical protein
MAKSREIRNVAVASARVIGASWAALYLARDEQPKTPNAAKRETPLFPGALLCQRLDENVRRLASTLDAPLYVVHLEGLGALPYGKRIALSQSARYGQSQREVVA